MAYDPVKAHEYYMKYRKKGLKKGRKSSKKSNVKSRNIKSGLMGLSISGLNNAGKSEWKVAKKKITDEMNSQLVNAKSDTEKDEILKAYQKIASKTLQDMKSSPSFASAKRTRTSSRGIRVVAKGQKAKGFTATRTKSRSINDSTGTTPKTANSGDTIISNKVSVEDIEKEKQRKAEKIQQKEAKRQETIARIKELREKLATRLKELPKSERKAYKAKLLDKIKKLKKRLKKLNPEKSAILDDAGTQVAKSAVDINISQIKPMVKG